MSRFLFGMPVMTLSKVVTDLNIEQENVKQNHFVSNMVRAKWIWKDILYNVAWSLSQEIVYVIDGKIKLPKNLVRLVNISVMDKCGNLQPLSYNPAINTLDLSCAPTNTCSCPNCGGDGTFCSSLDTIQVTEEEVEIKGTTYIRKIYVRGDSTGAIYRITENPTFSPSDEGVVTVENRELLCNVDVNETGCITATEPNRHKLLTYCGCWLPYNAQYALGNGAYCGAARYPYSDLGDHLNHDCTRTVPVLSNDYGYYNWDAIAGDVIHVKHVKAAKLIIAYQTNGEGSSEMLVPEYAVDAVKFGIVWRQKAFSPVVSRLEKRGAATDYQNAKDELWIFKNPMRMDDFIKAQTILPKW